MVRKREALDYHREGRPGKIELVPTKPLVTQRDLSLAYSPGVAEPCLEIAEDPERAWDYTARGNLVAVITNGSAVLGLGNIGPVASKPVMEGARKTTVIPIASEQALRTHLDALDRFVQTGQRRLDGLPDGSPGP